MENIKRRIEELNKALVLNEEELKVAENAKTTDASINWRREVVNTISNIKKELLELEEKMKIEEEKRRVEEEEARKAAEEEEKRRAEEARRNEASKVAYFHKHDDEYFSSGINTSSTVVKKDKEDTKKKEDTLEYKKTSLKVYKEGLETLREKYKDDKKTLEYTEPYYIEKIKKLEEEIAILEGKPVKKDEGEKGNQGNQDPKKDEGEKGNQGDPDPKKYDKGAIELLKAEQEKLYDEFLKKQTSLAKKIEEENSTKAIDNKYKGLATEEAKEKYETTSRMKFFMLKFAKNRQKYGFFRALFKSFKNDKDINESIYQDMYSEAYNSKSEKMKTEKEEKVKEISEKVEGFYNKNIEQFKQKDISQRMRSLEKDEKDMPPEIKAELDKIKKRMGELSEDIKKYNEEKSNNEKNNNKDEKNKGPKKTKEAPTAEAR